MKDIERMLVSAHEDGEVGSPWKERLVGRLAEDAEWSAEASLHRGVKAALASAPEPDFSESLSRIESRVLSTASPRTPVPRLPLAWMSVAAAALLALAVGSGYWLGSQNSSAAGTQVSELQVQVPRQLELKLSGKGKASDGVNPPGEQPLILRSGILCFALLLLAPISFAVADPDLVLVRITPQVVERDQSVSWEQPLSKVTKAGNPVVVNIDAAPFMIRVTVTPFVHGKNFLLVVQGDVRRANASGTHGAGTLQSALVPPGETIVFFPLGREPAGTGHQMVVKMQVEFQGE